MKPTICKHCHCAIEWLETPHADDGEWCASNSQGFNICEANSASTTNPFSHEPAMREYSEAELAEINANARKAANWGAGKRLRAQRLQAALQWAKLLAALGFTTLAGYFIGAAHRLC